MPDVWTRLDAARAALRESSLELDEEDEQEPRAYFENVSDEVAAARREAWQRMELEPLPPHTFRLGSPDVREQWESATSLAELVLSGAAEAGDEDAIRVAAELKSVKAWLESRAASEGSDDA